MAPKANQAVNGENKHQLDVREKLVYSTVNNRDAAHRGRRLETTLCKAFSFRIKTMDEILKTRMKNAPERPGVYLMKNAAGKVIYVGKAKDLKSRLASYMAGGDLRPMIPFLLAQFEGIDFVVTETEKEALILENNLIKGHRPRYNVVFRDDKTYFHLRLNLKDPFPRLELLRRVRPDGARYFGPFPNGGSARETLKFIQRIFPLRTCRDRELAGRRRPCLEHQIGRCLAPCAGAVDERSYRLLAADAAAFLEGKGKGLLADLERRMKDEALALNFEEAANIRDRIRDIDRTIERQRTSEVTGKDRDVFGFHREDNLTQVCALFIRAGKLVAKRSFPLITAPDTDDHLLASLIKQFYHENPLLPAEVIIPFPLEERKLIAEWLGDKRGRPVAVLNPRRGRAAELLRLAQMNAADGLRAEVAGINLKETLAMLAEKCRLQKIPGLIEGYDLSHLSGAHRVGGLVSFRDGVPAKENYRRFRIREATGADDYGMLYEVLKRRFAGKDPLPDLIIIDGGKGHLGVALSVLRDLGIRGVEVIALAKDREAGTKGGERIYLPGRKDPLLPCRWPAVHLLLKRISDEAHRFARSYHRKIRGKAAVESVLDKIAGVGSKRKKALIDRFSSFDRIREAAPEEIAKVGRIGLSLAAEIKNTLRDTFPAR